ncbi:MAG: transposase [Candidatus Omnitrophica bacterium]|nr:transposase [Candidatus Omnitrophota bacterium]
MEHLAGVRRHLRRGTTERRVAARARRVYVAAHGRPPGESARGRGGGRHTGWRTTLRYETDGVEAALYDRPHRPVGRGSCFPLARVRLQALACSPPSSHGVTLLRWSVRELPRAVLAAGRIETSHDSTVALILPARERQPHRSHDGKTPSAPAFVEQATPGLGYAAPAAALARAGGLVFCLDEHPASQALERRFPSLLLRAGRLERQAHECVRQRTVNWVVGLRLHAGRAWGRPFDRKSQGGVAESLERLAHRYRPAKTLHVIVENDSTPAGQPVAAALKASRGRRAGHDTPVQASWLNQADILLRILSRTDLRAGSWPSRDALARPLRPAVPEDHRFPAAPITWSFTRNAMHDWYDRYCSRN